MKDRISHRTILEEGVKPRSFSEIKDQLPGVVVVPPSLMEKLTDGEIKLLLSWNGIEDDEPIYFEELSTWGLFRPPLPPGAEPAPRKPPMVYSRQKLRR